MDKINVIKPSEKKAEFTIDDNDISDIIDNLEKENATLLKVSSDRDAKKPEVKDTKKPIVKKKIEEKKSPSVVKKNDLESPESQNSGLFSKISGLMSMEWIWGLLLFLLFGYYIKPTNTKSETPIITNPKSTPQPDTERKAFKQRIQKVDPKFVCEISNKPDDRSAITRRLNVHCPDVLPNGFS